jgi:hypothetical protein
MTANRVQQFDLMLTYLDRYNEVVPDSPSYWLYRANALLELDRPAEALAAADRGHEYEQFLLERELMPDGDPC